MRRATHLLGRAFRETGQALDRAGLTIGENEIFKETFARHRPIMNLFDKRPVTAAGVFVTPNSSVVGKVMLFDRVTVWYGAVLRGDKNYIQVGTLSSIGDRTVINTVSSLDSGFPSSVVIGDQTTIGAGAVITSSAVGSRCKVGAGAIIQEGCDISNDCIIAPGSVLLPNTVVPTGQFWAGNPATYQRDVDPQEIDAQEKASEAMYSTSCEHSEEFLPYGTVYQAAEEQAGR